MYEWKPDDDKNIKGIVQLVHGSVEHAFHYDDFAKFLVANNYVVIADDHRGHGKTALSSEDLGFFVEEEGWEKIIDNLYEVTTYIKKSYPNQPIVMFGHSMGSFMVRHYAIKYGTNIAALVICETAHYSKRLLKFSVKMAKIGQKMKGPKSKDNFIYKFSYAPLNSRYKKEGNLGTEWLSTDKTVQEAFANDPLTGQVFQQVLLKICLQDCCLLQIRKILKIHQITCHYDLLRVLMIRLENMGRWLWKLLIYIKRQEKKLKLNYIQMLVMRFWMNQLKKRFIKIF